MAYLFYLKIFYMQRKELIQKLAERKRKIGVSLDNIAKLSSLGLRTVNRLFANEDVKFSTIEKITNLFAVDFAGNEILNITELNKQRAHEKALYMASLVQQTSALELQGLENKELNEIIKKFETEFLTGSYKKTLWSA